MSRNLTRTNCRFCEGAVKLVEVPRPIAEEEAGYYYSEYKGMLVANAECEACLGKYLAWVTRPLHWPSFKDFLPECDEAFHDLSFRSTFNDEPGPDDLPLYKVEKRVEWVRTKKWEPKDDFWGAYKRNT